MVRKGVSLGFLVVIFFWGLTGCTRDVVQPEDDPVESIQEVIASNEGLFGMQSLEDEDTLFVRERHRRMRPGAPQILPRFLRRQVDDFSREVSVERITEDTALATITMSVTGTVFIGVNTDPENETRADTVWRKPFTVNTGQRAKFVRLDPGEFRFRGNRDHRWQVIAATPVVGISEESDLSLDQLILRNVSTGESLIITDALETFLDGESLPVFQRGDSLEVVAHMENGDDSGEMVMAKLHAGPFTGIRPLRLEEEATGIYAGSFRVRAFRGMGRLMLDLIDGDLYTAEAAPYNALFWHVPLVPHRPGPGPLNGETISGR